MQVNPNQFSIRPSSQAPQPFFQKIKSGISSKINFLASKLAQPLTFPGASPNLKDPVRLKKAEDEFLALGGESLVLNTIDGESLEAMYFDVDEVAKALGGDKALPHGAYHGFTGRVVRCLNVPDIETDRMLRDNHDWEHQREEIDIPVEGWSASAKNFLAYFKLCSRAVEKKKVFLFPLGEAKDRKPWENKVNGERPTVILCPGGACTYQMLKKVLIPAYLKRGINVMAVNYRGYGQSTGVPTEKGLNTDIETAYQYVSLIKNVPNERMIVHGHCLGSVPATELAANHEGVHLVLDRPIANYKMALKDSLGINLDDFKMRVSGKLPPILKQVVKGTIWVAGKVFIEIAAIFSGTLGKFDNASKLGRVKGSVAIIQSNKDEMLTSKHAELLASKVSQEAQDKGFSHIICKKSHSDAWVDEKDPTEKNADDYFDEFLRKSALLGSLI